MTDRLSGFMVVLEGDVREDSPYAAAIQTAIRQLKGVIDVRPIPADHSTAMLTEIRVDQAWRTALHHLAKDGPPR